MPKVVVGMSGGVDSSMTAHLLRSQGYAVEGVSFLMWQEPCPDPPARCSPTAGEEAAAVAGRIGIAHDVVDLRDDFSHAVIEPFVRAYFSGLTPNPCILCNRHVKFPALLREAERRGADYIATGHYARIEKRTIGAERGEETGGTALASRRVSSLLKKGVDARKDQSYVLSVLTPDILDKLLLPLGEYTKTMVIRMAADHGLDVSGRPESQEICFVREKNYLSFIQRYRLVRFEPGPIVGPNGEVIGTHQGIYRYTIGQRKRLGIGARVPLYVTGIDVDEHIVFVGPRHEAMKREISVQDVHWLVDPPSSSQWGKEGSGAPTCSLRARVKIRSTAQDAPATIFLDAGSAVFDGGEKASEPVKGMVDFVSRREVRVVFDEPQWAPAPGQSAVFYVDDVVIGGGIIRKSA